jgi:2-polyprenyl-6-methoxyphenol hydroxylase-like FAD-dependent oxidoreductase
MEEDVLVVGGGPAGSATAIYLVRCGHKVLLVDRAQFPRRKACGEGLFPRGVKALSDLGVLPQVEPAGVRIDGITFAFDGYSAFANGHDGGYWGLGLQRRVLDTALLEQARSEGVHVALGVTCSGLTLSERAFSVELNGKLVRPGIIVAADGVRSGLRQRAGLDGTQRMRRYGVTAHLRLAQPAPRHVEVSYERGYEVYVTPVGADTVNVALLLNQNRMRALAGRLEEVFLELIAACDYLQPGFELLDEPLTAGPFPASAKSVWRHNLVLVGDAAGFFDGITGDGMTLSLLSARDCAAAVNYLLQTGSSGALRGYEKKRRRLARNSTLLARLHLALASCPALGRMSIRNLARHPATFERLTAINSGDLGLLDLRPRDVLALAFGL